MRTLFFLLLIQGALFGQNRYHHTETTQKKGTTYLKSNMSPVNGIVYVKYHTNSGGNLQSETHYRNGKKEGPLKKWYAQGQIKCEGNSKKGKANGYWRSWHSNGQLKVEKNY